MCTKGIHGWVSINTLDQHLTRHLINILIDTPLTIKRHSIDISMHTHSTPLLHSYTYYLIYMYQTWKTMRPWKWVDSWPTVAWDILIHTCSKLGRSTHMYQSTLDGVSAKVSQLLTDYDLRWTEMSVKCWLSINWDANWVSFECQSRLDHRCLKYTWFDYCVP